MLVKALIVFAAFSLSLSSADFNRTEALNCLKSCKKSCTEAAVSQKHSDATKTRDGLSRRELIDCMKTCHSDQCVKR